MRSTALVVFLALASSAAQGAGLTAAEIKAAKRLYNAKCAKCHKFYDPGNYPPKEWETWMQTMGKKSKLKPDQYQLLARYLETFRTQSKDPVLKR